MYPWFGCCNSLGSEWSNHGEQKKKHYKLAHTTSRDTCQLEHFTDPIQFVQKELRMATGERGR